MKKQEGDEKFQAVRMDYFSNGAANSNSAGTNKKGTIKAASI